MEHAKRIVGTKAVDDYVKSGMRIGLGTGTTARWVVERLGEKLASGELTDVVGVPTSEQTRALAERLNVPLMDLEGNMRLDVCIDGADGIDTNLNLVKGRGGALLREKMVQQCSNKFIVVSDESKLAPAGLGVSMPMPVEIIPFSWENTISRILELPSFKECRGVLRSESSLKTVANNNCLKSTEAAATTVPFKTDNGNYIVDIHRSTPLSDPVIASTELSGVAGIVEHGIFTNCVSVCLIAYGDGSVEVRLPPTTKSGKLITSGLAF